MQFVDHPVAVVERMRRERADVVLADVPMPGLDGGQSGAEVCRRQPDTAHLIPASDVFADSGAKVVPGGHEITPRLLEYICNFARMVTGIREPLELFRLTGHAPHRVPA